MHHEYQSFGRQAFFQPKCDKRMCVSEPVYHADSSNQVQFFVLGQVFDLQSMSVFTRGLIFI